MSNQDVVKFGDTFYLRHESGQSLFNAERGRRNWPKLSTTGKVKLQLVGGNGEVTSGSPIKIRTTEEVTGNNNILGAFADSHDCYYWQDGYDNAKQSWQITKASGATGSIVYGDRVRISNISYTNQRLAPDPKNQGYITTLENAGDSWILEPISVRVAQPTPQAQKPISVPSVAQPTSVAQAPISVPSVAQPTPDQVTNQYQVQIQKGDSSVPWQEDGIWTFGRCDSDKPSKFYEFDALSDEDGQTLYGEVRESDPDETGKILKSPCQVTRSSGNYCTVVVTGRFPREFTWVVGSRTDKPIVQIVAHSSDGGQTIIGGIAYKGEEQIRFKGVRVKGGAAPTVAAADNTTTKAPQPAAPTVAATDNTVMKDKIKHVVVVMLENRGFDSVLGYLYEPGDEPKHLITTSNDHEKFHGLSFLPPEKFKSLGNPLVDEAGKPLIGKDGKPLVDEDKKPIEQMPVKGVRATNSPGWDPGEPYEHVNIQLFSHRLPPSSSEVPTMKGFVKDYSTECDGGVEAIKQIMSMYTPADLPVLSSLAKSYAVSDMWFASVPSQTNTNRAFSICGTSMGLVDNDFLSPNIFSKTLRMADDRFKTDTIWNVLDRNNIHDWAIFWHGVFPPTSHYPYTRNLFPNLENIDNIDAHFHKMEDENEGFFTKAKQGKLPAFSYIEPNWGGEAGIPLVDRIPVLGGLIELSAMGNEYHCPADVTPGEHLLQRIYESLTTSEKAKEAWKQTLLVILFDEHGGTYDHVPPPWGAKPPWGSQDPKTLGVEKLQYDFKFDRFGVRIPAILVSPLIEEGTVFRSTTDTPYDHTSLIATILKWKGISPNEMGERVSNAPTFDQVLTRTTPRKDGLDALPPPLSGFKPKQTSIGTPLKFGDPFYLQHEKSKEYVIGAYSGERFYFPQLGQVREEDLGKVAEKAPVLLDFRCGSGKVESGKAIVQIHTTEYLEPNAYTKLTNPGIRNFAGIRNFLGAWAPGVGNLHGDCYYYSTDDTQDYKQQYWTVSKVGGKKGDPICYGDKVYITSNYYEGQRLSKRDDWLSTAAPKDDNDSWVIVCPSVVRQRLLKEEKEPQTV